MVDRVQTKLSAPSSKKPDSWFILNPSLWFIPLKFRSSHFNYNTTHHVPSVPYVLLTHATPATGPNKALFSRMIHLRREINSVSKYKLSGRIGGRQTLRRRVARGIIEREISNDFQRKIRNRSFWRKQIQNNDTPKPCFLMLLHLSVRVAYRQWQRRETTSVPSVAWKTVPQISEPAV